MRAHDNGGMQSIHGRKFFGKRIMGFMMFMMVTKVAERSLRILYVNQWKCFLEFARIWS
jgi:hypothetical protein